MPEATSPIPARTPLRHALWLAGIFAALTFLIHFASSLWGSHLGYGFFRDELYFLVCGHHLAWGYVDQPPLVALQARLAETLFGLSPTGIRILSFLAAGVTVGLTGLLTWQLGGRRAAQVLAMMAALVCPVFLGTSNYLSMNSFEPCFWMGALLVVLRIAEGSASPRAWLLFGLLAGLGIENKHSTVFFLVALLIGLILRGCDLIAVLFSARQQVLLFSAQSPAGVTVSRSTAPRGGEFHGWIGRFSISAPLQASSAAAKCKMLYARAHHNATHCALARPRTVICPSPR